MSKDFNNNTIIKAKPKDKPYELRDGKVRGLILRVQPSGKKAWICELRNYKGRKRRKTITIEPSNLTDANIVTLAQARKEALAIISQPEKYFFENAPKTTIKTKVFGDFFKGPYQDYARSHIRSYKDVLPRIERNFGHLFDRDMDKIAETDIVRWQKAKTVSFSTLQREFTYLKACLNRAIDTYHLVSTHHLERYNLKQPRNEAIKKEHKDPRYLSDAEELRLRQALSSRDDKLRKTRISANNWRWERKYAPAPSFGKNEFPDYVTPLVLLALNTGLRRGDLFSLEWQHINFKLKHIRKVISKICHTRFGETPKTIPLSDEAFEILMIWRNQTQGKDLVFPNPKTGRRLDNINKAWAGVLKEADISGFRFHDLRHSFASKLVMKGIDLNTVRELMCHSDIKMTLVYAHLSPGHKENAIDRVFNQKN